VNVFETALHKVRRAPQRGADDSLRADDCSSEATDAVQHGEAMRLPAKHALKKMGAAAARGAACQRLNSIQFNSIPVTVTVTDCHCHTRERKVYCQIIREDQTYFS
jgi:hypothetical protein